MNFVYQHTANGEYKSNSVFVLKILCDTDMTLIAKKKKGTAEKKYYEWDFYKKSLKKGEAKQKG